MSIIVYLLFFWFLITKKYNNILFLLIFINVAIPKNEILEHFIRFNLVYDTRFVILILMLLVLIFRGEFSKLRIHRWSFLLFSLIVFSFTIGIFRGGNNLYFFYDVKLFITLILTFLVTLLWVKFVNIPIQKMIKYFIVNGIIYSLSTLFMYFLLDQSSLQALYGEIYGNIWGSRITFSNNTIQYVIVFISSYLIWKKINIKLNYISLILNFFSIIIAQNRTIIIITLATAFLIFFIILSVKLLRKAVTYKDLSFIFLLPSVLLIFLILGFLFDLSESNLIEDISNRFSQEGLSTLSYRNITNEFAINSVENILLGDGFGKILYSGGSLVNSYPVALIDNAFISIMAKLGILGVAIFISVILSTLILLFIEYKTNNDSFIALLMVIFPGYIVCSTYLTSQLIHAAPVYFTFFYIFTISLLGRKERKNENMFYQ